MLQQPRASTAACMRSVCIVTSPHQFVFILQAVFVPSTFSGEPRDFYLGVVHAESNRAYQNYFYKMQVGCQSFFFMLGICSMLSACRLHVLGVLCPVNMMQESCLSRFLMLEVCSNALSTSTAIWAGAAGPSWQICVTAGLCVMHRDDQPVHMAVLFPAIHCLLL